MTEEQSLLLFVAVLFVVSVIWLVYELWLRGAPVSEAIVDELAVKVSGDGSEWFRARVALHVDYSPEEHWVWINQKQHEALDIGSVLPVQVRTVRGKRRLRAVGHRSRVWWIAAASVFFLINLLNLALGGKPG